MEIKPYPKNAKKHPKDQVKKLAVAIRTFGFSPAIEVDKEGVIISGHGRYLAAQELGYKTLKNAPRCNKGEEAIPYIIIEDLTPEEIRLKRLSDNELAKSDVDMILQLEELKDLDLAGMDITLGGFDKDLIIEPDEKDDEVPETPEEPKSKLGDLYELGQHRVLCGDSTQQEAVMKLMDGNKADMVFTDPPYGVDYSGGIQFTKDGVKKNQRERLIDDHADTDIYSRVVPLIPNFTSGAVYMWFADTQVVPVYQAVEKVGDIHALLIWVKNGGYSAMNANYKQKHEPCLYWKPKKGKLNFAGSSTETTIWELDKDGKNEYHPTQKPVALSAKAIKNHDAKTVLDLFLGSGSTLIACEQTDRTCYGMELDPKYVDVIVQRYVDYTGNNVVKLNGKEIIWQK